MERYRALKEYYKEAKTQQGRGSTEKTLTVHFFIEKERYVSLVIKHNVPKVNDNEVIDFQTTTRTYSFRKGDRAITDTSPNQYLIPLISGKLEPDNEGAFLNSMILPKAGFIKYVENVVRKDKHKALQQLKQVFPKVVYLGTLTQSGRTYIVGIQPNEVAGLPVDEETKSKFL